MNSELKPGTIVGLDRPGIKNRTHIVTGLPAPEGSVVVANGNLHKRVARPEELSRSLGTAFDSRFVTRAAKEELNIPTLDD